MVKVLTLVLLFIGLFVCTLPVLHAQTTEFTYQGSMKDGASPANGNYDLEFKLFDLVGGGTQQGSTLQRLNVAVANGIFTVSLDFGVGTLPGADRFLDIAVRTAGGGAFTPLSPRQKVNSAPYSVKSLSSTTADTATNAAQLGGVAANQYVVTTDPRMTDARPPTAGSANYIQNQNAGVQAASSFNISGNGTAGGTLSSNIINATTQYNLGGSRILRSPGTGNLFAGFSAGVATTGLSNSFFGSSAGQSTTTGEQNSFFGNAAGLLNTTGSFNSFFGRSAGLNSTGSDNSFFGYNAGALNTTGFDNAFFGSSAGLNNTTGTSNTASGRDALQSNTTGGGNTASGRTALFSNTTGLNNTAIGTFALESNTTGNDNTASGVKALSSNSTGNNNTASGRDALAFTTGSNNIGLGFHAGRSLTNGDNNIAIGNVGVLAESNTIRIGTTGTQTRAFIAGINGATTSGGIAVFVNGSGQLGTVTSSRRFKDNIFDMDETSEVIFSLRPVRFIYKPELDAKSIPQWGLIAEEVNEVNPDLVIRDAEGEIQTVRYEQINAMMLNEVMKQQRRVETLISEKEAMKQRLKEMEVHNKKQQIVIDGLLKIICADKPGAEVCNEVK